MHVFLTKQKITYGIFIVEPIRGIVFNRGLLMNIGFLEVISEAKTNGLNILWDCFVFHDVDLIPEDERNIYSCPELPRHMSSDIRL